MVMVIDDIKEVFAKICDGDWLCTNRDMLGFGVSLVMLSLVMSIWCEMYRFSESIQLPSWSSLFPFPFLLPLYLVFICLIPAAFFSTSLRIAFSSVSKCVLISPLFDAFALMMSIEYKPLGTAIGNYLFVVLWICMVPAFAILMIRVLSIVVSRIFIKST